MGSKERRDRERQGVRAKILEAARELFLRDGVEAMSMRKVAERIEYSPTTIYLHFADKTALLDELMRGDFQLLGKQFQHIARVGDPIERLRQAGRAYIEFGLAHPNHYRTMFSAPPAKKRPGDPDTGDPNHDGYAFLRSVVQEAIASGRLRDGLRDAELVAQTMWAAVHGVVSLLLARGDDEVIAWRDREAIVELMLDTLVAGVAVPAPPGQRPERGGRAGARRAPDPAQAPGRRKRP